MRSTIVAITFSIFLLQSAFAAQSLQNSNPSDSMPDASVSASQPSPSGANDCLLVFYRPARMVGSAVRPSVYVDDRQIARLENGRYFSLSVTSGRHRIISTTKRAPLDLELKPNEIVYLEMSLVPGTWHAEGLLIPALAADATAKIAKLKRLDKGMIVESRVGFGLQLEAQSPATADNVTIRPVTPVSLAAGQTATSEPILEITSSPSGAAIELDGKPAGNSPLAITVSAGEHTVLLTKPGYKVWARMVVISSGRFTVAAAMEAEAGLR
jgi:hypothetical protein